MIICQSVSTYPCLISPGARPQHDLRLLLRHEPPVRPRNLGRGLRQEQGGQGGREIQTDARDALQLDVLGDISFLTGIKYI